jgi:DNA segregation ATPase FtsK/SpoIIIE-like protein
MHTESEGKSFVIEIGCEEALYRESSQPVNIESPKVNAQLIDVSGDKVLAEINERIQRGGSAFLISAVVVMVGIVAGLATGSINPPLGLGIAVTLSLVGITLGLILHNKQQNERVTTITYKMDDTASKRFSDVCKAVEVLSSSHQVWLVETKSDTTDWKRNANATSLINRRTVQVGRMQAPFIKTNAEVLSIDTGSLKLFFFPDCVFSYRNSNYETIPYKSLRITATTTRFIENERCPSDSEVVGRTWQRVNKDGGPDLRFKDNRQIPIILYGVLNIFSPQRLQLELQVSNKNAAFFFAQTINKELQDPSYSDQRARSEEGARGQSHQPKNTENIKSPYDILEIKKGASADEISSAYHRLAHMYHPDKVTSLAPEFRELAERRMKEINAAFAAIKNEGRQTDTEGAQREREQQTRQEQECRQREEELRQKTEEARKAKSGQETSSSASTRRQMAEVLRRRRQEQARSDVEAATTWTVPRGSASESEKSETTAQQPVGLAYKLPSVNLLEAPSGSQQQDDDKLRGQATMIAEKLKEFGVIGHIHHIKPGPIVTIFEFKPDPGVKFARIADLSDDLCLALKAESINVDRIPGKSTVGIEVPNLHREKVFLRELIESTKFQQSESKLMIALGKTMSGEDQINNLGKLPHLLIAGATGTGKSVMLNAIICSILYKASPEEVKFIMVDPKHVELGVYEGIPHLLTPIITDPKRAANALRWAVGEMEYRYREFATLGVADIEQYNRR